MSDGFRCCRRRGSDNTTFTFRPRQAVDDRLSLTKWQTQVLQGGEKRKTIFCTPFLQTLASKDAWQLVELEAGEQLINRLEAFRRRHRARSATQHNRATSLEAKVQTTRGTVRVACTCL